MIVNVGMVKEHFGGNTADMQASAAKEGVFFNYDSFQSKLAGAYGRYITPWPAPNDRNIILSHTALLPQASGLRVTDASPARKSLMAQY
jgi:hypothetical protein